MSDLSSDNAQISTIVHLPARIAPGEKNVNVLRVLKPSWIEILLVGEDNMPIPSAAFRIILPDGSTKDSRLDQNGAARLENFRFGVCRISFPELDADAWSEIE